MKKIITAVVSLLVLAMIFPVISCTAFAGENYAKEWDGDVSDSHFFDDTDFFTTEEELEITSRIQKTAKQLEMNIVVMAAGKTYRMSDSRTEEFADKCYDDLFGYDTDGVFFFIDFTEKKPAYDYISTSGKAVLCYQDHIQDILDAVYEEFPPSTVSDYSLYKDDIESGIDKFLSSLIYYSDNFSGRGSYYDENSGKYYYYKNDKLVISKDPPPIKRLFPILFAIPAGVIAAVIFFFTNKSAYKFKGSANPSIYVSNVDSRFTQRDDRFIRTYTTKHKIETSSGGSHGGGGHSGGGGGGHGGGGSHR